MDRVSDEELAEYAPGGDDAGLMAREIRAYRESGALEALTEILATYGGEELQMWVDNPHNQTGSRLGFFLSASTIRAMLAARGQMEAIESGAVAESKTLKAVK